GDVLGDEAGVQIGALSGTPHVTFAGGIVNNDGGEISSKKGPSLAIGGASFAGGVVHAGLITQPDLCHCAWAYEGVGVVFGATSVSGDLTNEATGVIEGKIGPAVWITDRTATFTGDVDNKGLIDGAAGGVRIEAGAFAGDVSNTGTINGGSA